MELSSKKFILNSDDAGLSSLMNEDILFLLSSGSLNSASVLLNGPALNSFISSFLGSPLQNHFQIKLHLNLTDGKSQHFKGSSAITDEMGHFKFTFISLLIKYYLASSTDKLKILTDLKSEIHHQISDFQALAKGSIKIDGHNHIHILPFVFDILMDAKSLFPIKEIRLPKERFYLLYLSRRNLKLSNFIKFLVLRALIFANSCEKKLKKKNISYNSHFFGVLFSDRFEIKSLRYFVSRASKQLQAGEFAEICTHPGVAEISDLKIWSKRSFSFFASTNRISEKKIISNFKVKA